MNSQGVGSLKTAIVIGATGLIGQELVRLLDQCDNIGRIVTITRREHVVTSSKVENFVVDFDQLKQHVALFNGDFLFCCLGTTKKQVGSLAAQRVIDVDYPVLAASIALAQGVKHCLVVSSAGASLASRSPYLQLKGQLESQLSALSFEHLSIFQPSLLLGKRHSIRLGEMIGGWCLAVITRLPRLGKYRPIQAIDVARKMLSVSQQQNLASVERFSLEKILL